MKQVLNGLSSFLGNPLSWITVIVFLVPVFLLIIKSWATTSLFLLFFICLWPISKHPKKYFLNRSHQFWALLACLLIPFFSELFAQMGRGEIVGSSLDGPARMIMAATVFVYLSKFNCMRVIQFLSFGAAVGVVGVFLSLNFYPDSYWGDRAATYFVDPITLPCFTVALLGLYLYLNTRVFPTHIDLLFKFALIAMTVYITIESQSRSAWVAFSCLLSAYLLYFLRRSVKSQLIGMVGLVVALMALYFLSDIIYARTNEAVSGVLAFFYNDESLAATVQGTSSGQRLLLFLIDIHLILDSPFFGVADRAALPPFDELQEGIPLLNKEIYEIKMLAGSHSEVLAQLARQGIIFGFFTLCGLFFYPLYVFLWKLRYFAFRDGSLSPGVLGIILPILTSSLTIQVFNLKMTISFYGLCLAIFFAYLCQNVERESTEKAI